MVSANGENRHTCARNLLSRYFFLPSFFLFDLPFSGLGSGGAARIFRRASSNECGASVKGLPAFPAGLGLSRFIYGIVAFL